ncbi:hypothetical protein [Sinosporangium siamense]|uniref:Aminoglycoside phosphotransferase domain-containing protein n=1 Tax=Sinosporangium siamense TaxID=1367973 RepID=A0A919V7A0_9ACTN|nr:hypothetical protein [Sinosporangium siamense]GII93258.1 hypothetical protein Ssi02_34890 [Sinosporangium siamense]
MNDAHSRLSYLSQTLDLLFPEPGPNHPHTLLPHSSVPRRLVPRRWWHLPFGRPTGIPVGDDTIASHLAEVLGTSVRIDFHVRSARRANRKPVLEVYDGHGSRIAFVKIGDTALTAELVRAEATTLHMLSYATLSAVTVPSVLYHGTWRGLEVLALSPLPVRRFRSRPGTALRVRAVKEIAEVGRLRGAGWSWHGDFSPWNFAAGPDGRLLVWDWERFDTDVPLGVDELHHFFQRALQRMPPQVAAESVLVQAVRVLAPYDVTASEARNTALHYLITLARRHADEGYEPLGPPQSWLTPLVDRQEGYL